MVRVGNFWRRIQRTNVPLAVILRLGLLIPVFLAFGGVGMWLCERERNPAIRTFGSAYAAIASNSAIGFGDITPLTNCGRTVGLTGRGMSFVAFAGVLGAMNAGILEVMRRRRRGLTRIRDRGHVVVCGWNAAETPVLVETLLRDGDTESVVVVSSLIEELPIDSERVRFVHGAPYKRAALKQANIAGARAVLVPARDANDPASDAFALLICQSVRLLAPSIHISVEIVDPASQPLFPDCAVMTIGRMASQLMAQSIAEKGVEQLIAELVSPDEGATLCRMDLPPDLVGKTFGELLHWSADHNNLAIGVERDGEPIANPPRDLVTRAGDVLYVIAQRKKPQGGGQ